jgi:hypothetical protein
MPPLFTIKGYTASDPLDKAPTAARYILAMSVTALIGLTFFYLESSHVMKIVVYPGDWVVLLAAGLFTFIVAPVIVSIRKSSSLVIFFLILIPCVLLDLYFEANVRPRNGEALWYYLPDNFISAIPVPLRFFAAWAFDAMIMGPLCLWLARLLAKAFYDKNVSLNEPTPEQQNKLFKDEWTSENIEKPKRDVGYWILRLLGLGYLAYLLLLIVGALGYTPWPEQIGNLIWMTYENPALAINTYSKISIMLLLAFIGAYNIKARWHCTLALFVGHIISTIYSFGFYFFTAPSPFRTPDPVHEFLFTSGIVDGVMVVMFGWMLIKYKEHKKEFTPEKKFPAFYSTPAQISSIVYNAIAVISVLMAAGGILFRFFADGNSGLGAVYGYPDPTLGNTTTLYLTTALISFLLAKNEKLRDYLFGVLLFPFFIGIAATIPWMIIGNIFSDVVIRTRSNMLVSVDWYFMLFLAVNLAVFSLLIVLRKMYYNVENVISTLNPSSAKNASALLDALFKITPEEKGVMLQYIDQYVGGITGRKRGLLNFPFWIVEHFFNFIFGLHPNFSIMSREERRYFIRKYLLRPPQERKKSFMPDLAEFAYQIGLAANAIVTFAHYSHINKRKEIGFIPLDARDRLQGDIASFAPPFKGAAPLPTGPEDPANLKSNSLNGYKFIAPRVSTPIEEPDIPDEADYIIIGSGAGGAVTAYRLACMVKDPSKILLVERGSRYQPMQDFNDNEMEMMRKLYKEGGLQQTKNFSMSVLQGECVGGTTVVNNAVCFEMSPNMKSMWENQFDIDLSNLENEYQKIAEEIEIQTISNEGANQKVKEKFESGVNTYCGTLSEGKLVCEPLKINSRNNIGDGNWNLGNKRLRKLSMLETYLPWAEGRGVKIVSNVSGVNFIPSASNHHAEAVLVRTRSGELKKIKVNKAVIAAGGVIASSHFLMRSGLFGNVGKNMSCNFAFPFTFEYSDILDAFDGTQITIGAKDPDDRAVFETYFNPPASFALSSVPFFFERREKMMKKYRNLINYGALVGSEPNGVIEKKADMINGRPFSWELGEKDKKNIKYAFATLLNLGLHSGALKAYIPTKPGIEIEISEKNIADFISALENYPLRMEDLNIGTAHPQGGNRMAGDNSPLKDSRVVNGKFQVEGFENVFVSDASLFPVSMGLNPQWTIMALSSLASKSVVNIHE